MTKRGQAGLVDQAQTLSSLFEGNYPIMKLPIEIMKSKHGWGKIKQNLLKLKDYKRGKHLLNVMLDGKVENI